MSAQTVEIFHTCYKSLDSKRDWSGEPREWSKNRAVASFLEFNWIMGCQAWIYGDISSQQAPKCKAQKSGTFYTQ